MTHGLSKETVEGIRTVLARHPAVARAILYGSRAMGTHKPGSDIDLTLCGALLGERDLALIEADMDDLLMPQTVDLSAYHRITHQPLRDHIERVGVPFYSR